MSIFIATFTCRSIYGPMIDRNFNWDTWYNRKVRLICHIIFWLLVTLLYYLGYRRLGGDYIWLFVAKELLVTGSLFYSASWISSHWQERGKIYTLILFIMFSYIWWLFWTYLTCYVAQYYIPESATGFHRYIGFFLNDGFWGLFKLEKIGTLSIDFITMVSIPLAPKLTKVLLESSMKMVRLERDMTRLELDKAKLERDNLVMELDFLKSQVSPHFLFNILNSIYRMSEQNDPKTPDTVLQLSNLMRYMLYEGKDDEIQLSREAGFINNYIELARIRYGDKVPLHTEIADINEPYKIAPLILIPFVENAFKHGPDRSRKNCWVDISLNISNDTLFLRVKNGVNHQAEKPPIGGLGLQNARRRLDIHYPKCHSLNIEETENSYGIELVIHLK